MKKRCNIHEGQPKLVCLVPLRSAATLRYCLSVLLYIAYAVVLAFIAHYSYKWFDVCRYLNPLGLVIYAGGRWTYGQGIPV